MKPFLIQPIELMMNSKYMFFLTGLLLMALPGTLSAAESPGITDILSAETSALIHIRSVPALRAQWKNHPLAKTWAEPEVQAFFAPAIEAFQTEYSGGLADLIYSETGLSPEELLDLMPGELAVAILDLQLLLSEDSSDEAALLIIAEMGDTASEMKALLERLTDEEAMVHEEEFQGETLHIIENLTENEDDPIQAITWAMVDNLLLVSDVTSSVQEAIANQKQGGSDNPISQASGFSGIYRAFPAAQGAAYLNLDSVVSVMTKLLREAESEGTGEAPSTLANMGITADSLVEALGLGHLSSGYAVFELEETFSIYSAGIKWDERPNLMRVLAYGDAPAPRPDFIPDNWVSVSSTRFNISDAYRGLKEVIGEVSPALPAMLDGVLAQYNVGLGIDIERDLVGNFGDEIIQAEALTDARNEVDPLMPTDQFFAVSIHDQDTAQRMVDAAMVAVPALAQMITSREYLGETIYLFEPPQMPNLPPDTPQPRGFAYALTRNYLLIGLNGSSMIEAAIQGLDGASHSIWDNQGIIEALEKLPPDESAISYMDTRRLFVTLFDLFVEGAFAKAPEDGPPLFDLKAKPSPEVLSRHWGHAVSGVYLEADGIRSEGRLDHGSSADE